VFAALFEEVISIPKKKEKEYDEGFALIYDKINRETLLLIFCIPVVLET
jgi:hypothetical protein